MRPRRCFVEGELQPGERSIIGKSARYLSGVLRLRTGERIVLFDGSGWEFPAEILAVSRQGVRVLVAEGVAVKRESPLTISLGLGLCQPATMDLVIQKATELGVTEITPVRTERSQGWLARERATDREGRWERIAREAARQCGRNRIPRISPQTDLPRILCQKADEGLRLIFWEGESNHGLRETLAGRDPARVVHILIGPEGGFTPAEVEEAVAAGFQGVSLGRRILRTETAAIAVISVLQYEMGDLGVLP